jgi:hypothetical protein
MTCCVYWIRLPEHTDPSKEGYVGLSTNFEIRMKSHFGYSNKEDTHVYRAIRKYGWDNLIKEVLIYGSDDHCKELEFKLRPAPSIGWNEIPGGNFSPSKSKEVAKKISDALKGKCFMKHTEASKAKIAEANRKRVLSEESKKRIADAMRKNQQKRIELMNSKYTYYITFPNGKEEVTTNLKEWCEMNNLKQSSMLRVATGERKHHKQYRCKRVTIPCEHSPELGGANR